MSIRNQTFCACKSFYIYQHVYFSKNRQVQYFFWLDTFFTKLNSKRYKRDNIKCGSVDQVRVTIVCWISLRSAVKPSNLDHCRTARFPSRINRLTYLFRDLTLVTLNTGVNIFKYCVNWNVVITIKVNKIYNAYKMDFL